MKEKKKPDLLRWDQPELDPKILQKSALTSSILMLAILTLIGSSNHWLAHPTSNQDFDPSRYIETEFYDPPKTVRLVEKKKQSHSKPLRQEVAINKESAQKDSGQKSSLPDSENLTQEEDLVPITHGPMATYAPPPVLPHYLHNREINAHVSIDFYVSAQGQAVPHLVGSSGDEELDALALDAVKKWKFQPGKENNHPIDSKVRLKILFEVR